MPPPPPQRQLIISPGGIGTWVDITTLSKQGLPSGYRVATPTETEKHLTEAKFGGLGGALSAGIIGVTRGTTFGQFDPAAIKVSEWLEGEKGARRDVVLLNAAAVLVAAEKAQTMEEGLSLAAEPSDEVSETQAASPRLTAATPTSGPSFLARRV